MYPPALQELMDHFERLPEQERRENLILLAEGAGREEPRPGEAFDVEDVRKDAECTDTVGVFLRAGAGDRVRLAMTLGPRVQTLTRAMAVILCRGLNGATLRELSELPGDFVTRIIGADLVRVRSRTVYYVLDRMKTAARMLLERRAAPPAP